MSTTKLANLIVINVLLATNWLSLTTRAQSTTTTTTTTTTRTTRTTTTTTRPPPQFCYNQFCWCTPASGGISPDFNMLCSNFDTWNQLDFVAVDPDKQFARLSPLATITLNPNQPLALNSSLNMTGLTTSSTSRLVISSLSNVELDSQPLSTLNFGQTFSLELVDSVFRLTHGDGQLFACDHPTSLPDDASLSRVLAKVLNLYLTRVQIPEPLCPYAFRNLRLQSLFVSNLDAESKIEFHPTHHTDGGGGGDEHQNLANELNCNITQNFVIENSTLSGAIDAFSNLLHYDVFRRISRLKFNSVAIDARVRPDTFLYFSSLIEFTVSPIDWRPFLLANQNMNWLSGLNSNVMVDLTNSTDIANKKSFPLYMGKSSDSYDYPEEDFCYFADFPHHRNLLPYVNFNWQNNASTSCSCTLLYVLQYAPLHKPLDSSFNSSSGRKVCLQPGYQQAIEECDFPTLLNSCSNEEGGTLASSKSPSPSPSPSSSPSSNPGSSTTTTSQSESTSSVSSQTYTTSLATTSSTPAVTPTTTTNNSSRNSPQCQLKALVLIMALSSFYFFSDYYF